MGWSWSVGVALLLSMQRLVRLPMLRVVAMCSVVVMSSVSVMVSEIIAFLEKRVALLLQRLVERLAPSWSVGVALLLSMQRLGIAEVCVSF